MPLLLLVVMVVVGMGDTGGKGGAVVVVVGVGGGSGGDASLALSLSGMRLIFSFLSVLGFFSVGGGGKLSVCGEDLLIVVMVEKRERTNEKCTRYL